jgi:hypothetical protein
MKKTNTFIIICLVAAVSFLGGCSAMKKLDLYQLQLGMSKEEAIRVLGKKPENLIGAKRFDDGDLEVLEFTSWRNALSATEQTGPLEQFWLYFFNDRLVEWGKPADWSYEMERVYRKRHVRR